MKTSGEKLKDYQSNVFYCKEELICPRWHLRATSTTGFRISLWHTVKIFGSKDLIRQAIFKNFVQGDHAQEIFVLPAERKVWLKTVSRDGNWVLLESQEMLLKKWTRTSKNDVYKIQPGSAEKRKIKLWGYIIGDATILSDRYTTGDLTKTLENTAYLQGLKFFFKYPNPSPRVFCYDNELKLALAVTAPPLFNKAFGFIKSPDHLSSIEIAAPKLNLHLLDTPVDSNGFNIFRTEFKVPIKKFVRLSALAEFHQEWEMMVHIHFAADFSLKDRVDLKWIQKVEYDRSQSDKRAYHEAEKYFERLNVEQFEYSKNAATMGTPGNLRFNIGQSEKTKSKTGTDLIKLDDNLADKKNSPAVDLNLKVPVSAAPATNLVNPFDDPSLLEKVGTSLAVNPFEDPSLLEKIRSSPSIDSVNPFEDPTLLLKGDIDSQISGLGPDSVDNTINSAKLASTNKQVL